MARVASFDLSSVGWLSGGLRNHGFPLQDRCQVLAGVDAFAIGDVFQRARLEEVSGLLILANLMNQNFTDIRTSPTIRCLRNLG